MDLALGAAWSRPSMAGTLRYCGWRYGHPALRWPQSALREAHGRRSSALLAFASS